MKKIISIAVGLGIALAAMAQPMGGGMPPMGMGGGMPQFGGGMPQGERPQMGNAAKAKADRMNEELALTEKQYKKVLKVYKQEENSLHPSMSNGGGMMGGPGGGPGMGGPGGGMGPGGMGGPGMGGPGGGNFGGGDAPMGMPPGMDELSTDELEKIMDKKEKQLRKILTPEQFNTWASRHPEEFSLQMPEMK